MSARTRLTSALALLLMLASIAPTTGFAQQLEIQTERGPHYAGEPVRLVVTATGFKEQPTPEIDPPDVAGQLSLVRVNPSVSSQIRIINGRFEQSRQVSFQYEFSYLPEKPGDVVFPPFRVTQGSTELRTKLIRLRISKLATSDEIAIALQLPKSPIYVGARLPVSIRFYLSDSIQENLQNFSLRVPFFDPSPDFRFLDDDSAEGGTQVPIVRAGAPPLELRGSVRRVTRAGKPAVEITVTRTLIPLRAGKHQAAASTLVVDEGTRWRRDLFGRRSATRVRKLRAEGRAQLLEVANLPSEGRPASFAGAVGKGFSLEVSADRTVVQVGDPIALTLVLRGEGLETASLPRLDADGLLPKQHFRVPGGALTGVLEGDTKRFTATVRVLDDSVREIPPLEYAWFDPDSKTYQTTQSRPIALGVRSAEIIGAAQVESRLANAADPEADAGATGESAKRSGAAPRARSFALSGADLAIERDPGLLLRSGGAGGAGGWLEASLYGGSLAFVGLALLDRRRRSADPVLLRRRALLASEVAKVRAACSLPDAECAAEFSRALRRMLAEVRAASDAALRREVDAFLGDCDARSYAPPGQGAELDDVFRERGRTLAGRIAESAQ